MLSTKQAYLLWLVFIFFYEFFNCDYKVLDQMKYAVKSGGEYALKEWRWSILWIVTCIRGSHCYKLLGSQWSKKLVIINTNFEVISNVIPLNIYWERNNKLKKIISRGFTLPMIVPVDHGLITWSDWPF